MNFAPGKTSLWGNSRRKCIYSVPAQETAKHHAQFGWLPLSDVAAVTKPRRETPLKFAGVPQTTEPISAAIVGRSSPYCEDVWGDIVV